MREMLIKKLDELENEYVDFLADICRIESPTDFKEGVDAVGRYIIEKAENRGWKIEINKQAVSGDAVCITMNPNATEKPVCFSGHIDTVHPVGLFKEPIVTIDSEKMYGPGTLDCKGGIAASFMAMAALSDIGFTKRPVKLIIQSDEENGSRLSNKATVEFMCEKAKDAIAFLNTEGHAPGKATCERKGIRKYNFEVTGKAVHSAACYDGASAVKEAAHKIIKLEKMKDENGLTCNCGLINGGTAENTVPEKCFFSADIRFKTEKQMKKADKLVKKIAEKNFVKGTKTEVKLASWRYPMEKSDKNRKLLERVNEIFSQNNITTVKWTAGNGGSDAADLTHYGVPTLDNLGVTGGDGHSVREYIDLKSIKASAKMLSFIALEI